MAASSSVAPRISIPARGPAAAAPPIPDLAIETLARGFCREAQGYGFGQIEFVKFVNAVLDKAMADASAAQTEAQPVALPPVSAVDAGTLPLEGERVVIRTFDPATDFATLERWLGDRRGRDFLLSRVTAKRADVRELVADGTSAFGMITLRDATPVGTVAFLDHDPVQRKAEMRKLIGEPDQRGKGLAREASELWIRYGLAGLGLKKIYVSTFHTNVRNVRLNQELGFKVEGILRNEVLVDGRYQDVLRMGLWADGYGAAPGDLG
jgi:RimJ/RimL family protein N-acetyltransferase